jgi:hypothetical protein
MLVNITAGASSGRRRSVDGRKVRGATAASGPTGGSSGGSSRRGSIAEGSTGSPTTASTERNFSYWLHVNINPEVNMLGAGHY